MRSVECLVFEDSSNCGIVECSLACHVGSCEHEKGGIWEVGFGVKKKVCGLSWCDQKSVGFKGFDINGIYIDYCETVVCNAEEKFVV